MLEVKKVSDREYGVCLDSEELSRVQEAAKKQGLTEREFIEKIIVSGLNDALAPAKTE